MTTGPDGIDIVGKGDGQVPAFAVNQPYYIATIDVGDMENAILTIPGHDLPALMTIGKTLRVLHVPEGAKQVSFTVEATGAYMVHLAAPPSTASAKTAPASALRRQGRRDDGRGRPAQGGSPQADRHVGVRHQRDGRDPGRLRRRHGSRGHGRQRLAGNAEEQANENAKGPVFAIVTSAHDSWTLEFQS